MPTINNPRPAKLIEVFAIVTGDDKLISISLSETTARVHLNSMGGATHGWRIVRFYQDSAIANLLTYDGTQR